VISTALRLITLFVCIVSASVGPAWAQNSQPPEPPQLPNLPQSAQPAPPTEMEEEMQRAQIKKANEMRQAQIKRDTDKLLELSTELKAYVDKTNQNILSVDVIKKADEIEKLAHSVKEKMKE
jgi:hypothetical protein